jgi:hypothetical protein
VLLLLHGGLLLQQWKQLLLLHCACCGACCSKRKDAVGTCNGAAAPGAVGLECEPAGAAAENKLRMHTHLRLLSPASLLLHKMTACWVQQR